MPPLGLPASHNGGSLVDALQAYYGKGPTLTDDQLRIARAILRAEA
jgi:hypothetical protein